MVKTGTLVAVLFLKHGYQYTGNHSHLEGDFRDTFGNSQPCVLIHFFGHNDRISGVDLDAFKTAPGRAFVVRIPVRCSPIGLLAFADNRLPDIRRRLRPDLLGRALLEYRGTLHLLFHLCSIYRSPQQFCL